MSRGSERGFGRRNGALTPAGTERPRRRPAGRGRAPETNSAWFTAGGRPDLGTHTSL